MADKPTVEDIITLKGHLSDYYRTMHRNFSLCEEGYEGTFKIPVAKGFQKYIPPTGRAVVDTAVDHYVTQHPLVEVPRQKDSTASQEHSDRMEKFYHNIINENISRNVVSPIREAAKQLALYGMFCLKGPWIDERYLEDEEKYSAGFRRYFPFNFRVINPVFVLPEPSFFWTGHGGVMECYKRTASEIKAEWPEWKTDKEYKPTDLIECIQHINDDWILYIVDEEFVDGPKPNTYRFVPYEIGFSGMGRVTDKPEDLAVGLLWPVLDALKLEARVKSALDAIIQTYAFPRLGSMEDLTQIKLGEGPNSIAHLPGGKDSIFELITPRVPPDLYNHIRVISDDVQRGTFSDVIYGERPAGVDSGYHQRSLVSEVRMRFGEGVSTLETKLANVLGKCAYLMENIIPGPVSIWGRLNQQYYEETIKPADVKGHYTCYVTLAASTPEEDERTALTGLEMKREGVISHLRYLEKYAKVADATGEMKRIIVEGILAQPEIRQALANAALKDWGLDEYLPPPQPEPGRSMNLPGSVPQAAIPGGPVMPAMPGGVR